MNLYNKDAFPWEYEPYFSKHMQAMTAENLESKADIALEFARRDKLIAELEEKVKCLVASGNQRYQTMMDYGTKARALEDENIRLKREKAQIEAQALKVGRIEGRMIALKELRDMYPLPDGIKNAGEAAQQLLEADEETNHEPGADDDRQ